MRHGSGGVGKASTCVRCNAWHATGLCVACAWHMHTRTCHAHMHMHMPA